MDRQVIDDLDLSGKRVLTRVDFNVPIADGKVIDDTRIEAALPTIKKIIGDKGRLILMSHLGRPKGEAKEEFRLKPVCERLSELIGQDVKMATDCVGESIENLANGLADGKVLLLENTRFHKEETANDAEFAKQLANLGDVYINDAFGAAHRAHASTQGVAKLIKESGAGYLMQSEVENLTKLLENAEKPYVVILGGAKVSDKLKVIHNLVTRVNAMLIGGGMAYTFLKAKQVGVGNSILDEERIAMAYNSMVVAQNPHPYKKLQFLLPEDHIIANGKAGLGFKTSGDAEIPADWRGVDIGPKTVAKFKEIVNEAKTIFWNGPMGIFEDDNFAKGTIEIANAVAQATDRGAFTVVGGGDSIAAIEKAGVKDKISHVSTGGGASLEFLGGIDLPGIMALAKAKKKAEPAKKEDEN
ncbi:phosphoglycerate kinase [candidate division KSB1 bacterium]|nr:phosphoglycerate kinase [candidate division KSB1 bacterium]